MKYLLQILIFSIVFNPMEATEYPDGWSVKTVSTSTFDTYLSNCGSFNWFSQYVGITHLDYPSFPQGPGSIVFNQCLWFTGYKNSDLIGALNDYAFTFSPGPIINGTAAMEIHPEDSTDYRLYYINQYSGPGDPDYEDWPTHLGAPVHDDGTPKVYGTQTVFSVYNDARPGEDYGGNPLTEPTGLQIAETVWSYDNNPALDNTLFFRYRIHNRDSVDYQNVTVGIWAVKSYVDFMDRNSTLHNINLRESIAFRFSLGKSWNETFALFQYHLVMLHLIPSRLVVRIARLWFSGLLWYYLKYMSGKNSYKSL